jgi:GntP family gluconate:H+ symporter
VGEYYPLLVLVAGVAFVVIAIIRFRVHAFLALILASLLVGLLSDRPYEGAASAAVGAVDLTATEFGNMVASIGIVIAMASIIGKCLMDSGAADSITRRLLRLLGEKRAPQALLGSGYILSMPVFFDTVFYLLVPLAKTFRMRTGGRYVFYVMAICAGGGLAHNLVAPTPGPLVASANLHLNLGTTIIVGIAFSLLPAVLIGRYFADWLDRRYPIPLRPTPDMDMADLEKQMQRPDSALPPFWLSILPIVLPVAMIAASTVTDTINSSALAAGRAGIDPLTLQVFGFLGNKNVAMLVSALVALIILMRQAREGIAKAMSELEPAIASAGIIILITAAGGAFGAMIRHAGVGDLVRDHMGGGSSGTVLLLVSFGIAAIMKSAQGSSTVAMVTASAIMFGVIDGMTLPFHPVYVFLSIGFGSMVISWMNDSGFWVVGKMSGFTEAETLRTWTLVFGLAGLVGFIQTLILAQFLPLTFLP